MRRTQLYLDDHLWNALHTRARDEKTTISELVREAVRERYLGNQEQRRIAMQKFVGSRKDPPDAPESTELIRALRKGSRMERIFKQ
jgi:predicted DNA-binding ribbon-helix-helix protein